MVYPNFIWGSYSKYYFIIDRIQKRAFSNQVEIKVNHTHWEAKSDLMSSPNVCNHLRTRNGKEWTLHWFPLELMKPVVVSSNVGVFSGWIFCKMLFRGFPGGFFNPIFPTHIFSQSRLPQGYFRYPASRINSQFSIPESHPHFVLKSWIPAFK